MAVPDWADRVPHVVGQLLFQAHRGSASLNQRLTVA